MNKILTMKISTKEDYISIHLPNFDGVTIKFLEFCYEHISNGFPKNIKAKSIPGYREMNISYKNEYIASIYIDERFNTIHLPLYTPTDLDKRSIYNKVYKYIKDKYLELRETDFRYGKYEENSISPTIIIFIEDFFDYLKDDIRDFKINKLLNEKN